MVGPQRATAIRSEKWQRISPDAVNLRFLATSVMSAKHIWLLPVATDGAQWHLKGILGRGHGRVGNNCRGYSW